uniref:DDHD domain-containing protein n=1 Tax=Panagrellus redivivus TaxID=6233 RepID=A0A7E4UTF1_PANRE
MLIKEYRILFPMSVEEYKIGQLYMIQKMSTLESGVGSGVEILENEPYDSGPGGHGQYTFKVYHFGDRIPSWIRNVLPSHALQANEEAWNAYPTTRTKYSSPLMDRFSIEIDTLYFNDAGTQDNVFNLSESELKHRVVDVMDFVTEPHGNDYIEDEDPKLYHSTKTGRGPLSDNWVKEHLDQKLPIMCAYKLCKVEFKYWGMQGRIERWIHDLALRGMLLKSHRRAWAWQDEWVGLTMDDIRKLEKEAALYLSKVMASNKGNIENIPDSDSSSDIFFDCYESTSPLDSKPSLIRWSSELLVDEEDSPPSTPKVPNNSLLILVFHGEVYDDLQSEKKTTDYTALKSILDTLVLNHYPQLKNRMHVLGVPCGAELLGFMSQVSALSPCYGAFHPTMSLLMTACNQYGEAVQMTVKRANKVYKDFLASKEGQGFTGDIFVIGDTIGGVLMYEALCKQQSSPTHSNRLLSRHSSSLSATSRPIPEGKVDDSWLYTDFDTNTPQRATNFSFPSASHRNVSAPPLSAPPSATHCAVRKKVSTISVDPIELNTNNLKVCDDNDDSPPPKLLFRPNVAFLVGCPLAMILLHRKINGYEVDGLECDQLFNLFYDPDICGGRLEPVLNSQLAVLPSIDVPRYQRYPLGDGRRLLFDHSTALCNSATLWGPRRIDHKLDCPTELLTMSTTQLPCILHSSYWENVDVGAFILRQFVRTDDNPCVTAFSTTGTVGAPLNIEMEPLQWNRRRTRFKIANLTGNHRANDIIVVEGHDQIIHAKFCYGPMDLVALSRENIHIYICPYGGDWYFSSTECTDAHGKLTVNLGQRLAIGIHAVKMIVSGDHSYLDMYIAVVPPETRCVVFSIDGSLTGSVSVTGRDPRVRPGAVDVVRFWQQQGYLVIYVTARPDMQQRVVSSWLAQHNFPHGLLFFTPSISTDPLRHKAQLLRHFVDLGLKLQAAYGSNKDVPVYAGVGIEPDRIFSVSHHKRKGCVSLEDGYAQHLHDLHAGRVTVAQAVVPSALIIDNSHFTPLNHRHASRLVQRTHSFTPRSGKYDSIGNHGKKGSQASISTR